MRRWWWRRASWYNAKKLLKPKPKPSPFESAFGAPATHDLGRVVPSPRSCDPVGRFQDNIT